MPDTLFHRVRAAVATLTAGYFTLVRAGMIRHVTRSVLLRPVAGP